MFYIYILKSLNNEDFYIGSMANVQERFRLHNAGKVRSTKYYRPWKLLNVEAFQTRADALKRERFLKTGQQRELLKRKYGAVAK